MAEWFKALVLKTRGGEYPSVGSNPTSCAIGIAYGKRCGFSVYSKTAKIEFDSQFPFYIYINASVAQLAEQRAFNSLVGSSNLFRRTINNNCWNVQPVIWLGFYISSKGGITIWRRKSN